ncbi:MAG: VOC family protein [Bacteroidales bacterium]
MKKLCSLIAALAVLFFSSELAHAQGDFSSKTIHIGVIASDLDESLDFYKEVVGMKQTGEFSVDETMAKESGLSNGVPFDVKVLKLGNGEEATQFKLMSFGDRADKQHNDYIYDHSGMQYITINVKDLSPVIERVKANNVTMQGSSPVKLGENRYLLLIRDPDGTFVELIGPWTDK